DGIRDLIVTGVQTCALPIYDAVEGIRDVEEGAVAVGDAAVEREQRGIRALAGVLRGRARLAAREQVDGALRPHGPVAEQAAAKRSEERRVGKEGRIGGVQCR